MYSNFTEEARKVLIGAKEEMLKLRHPYVGSEHLLLSILKDNNDVSKKLKEYNLDYDRFRDELTSIVGLGSKPSEYFLYTPLLKRVMENAMCDSKEVTINHLFNSLLEEGEGVAIRILISMNIDINELNKIFKRQPKRCKSKKLTIDTLGVDLTKKASNNELDPVVGREKEIKRLIEILCRRKKNNPILIGPAGVGKTAIVEELSRMIASGNVPEVLKNKRIISLDMATTVAGTKYRGEFEERLNKILNELEDNDDIILFIDEIHTLVGAGGAEGAIDASNIFKPALARNKMRLIGATTTEEYKKFIVNDKALDRRFQKIDIDEPSKTIVREILLKLKDTYSDYHNVIVPTEIIDYIIDMSDRYIKFRKEPDRSIDILDEVCAHVSIKKDKKINRIDILKEELNDILIEKKNLLLHSDYENAIKIKKKEDKVLSKINKLELTMNNKMNTVTKGDVITVISSKSNTPIYELKKDSNKELDELTSYLKKNIIGEDKVIDELMKSYKKIKLGLNDNKCYSILFNGPVGVGKTTLATIFSNKISNNVIRIDSSEYSEPHTISKLIGTPSGYVGYGDNNIFESIKDNPFTVVIIDEIDKLSSNILSLFNQIFDEGKLTDSKGDTIYFNNVIFIMTTNIGNTSIGFNKIMNNELINCFGKSFVNKIDSVIEFDKLDNTSIKLIINNTIKALKSKYKDTIKINIHNGVKEELINLSNYEEMGARKIEKLVKMYLDTIIIDNILLNKNNVQITKIFN